MQQTLLPLVGRILIAALFLVAGLHKIMIFSQQVGYFTRLGFPLPEVATVLSILVEVGGALALIAGWRTRCVAWLLIVFTLVATFMAHRFWEFEPAFRSNQMNHFLKNFAIIGGLLFLAAFGPGPASLGKRE
jgi:putative oxidoreductase